MTCIIGFIETKDNITTSIIAGDTGANKDCQHRATKSKKIFQHGDFMFGGCGSFRQIQIVKSSKKLKKLLTDYIATDLDLHDFIVNEVATVMIEDFTNNKIDINNEDFDVEFIIIYKDRLFSISTDFAIIEYDISYATIGCSENIVNGTLKYMHNYCNNLSPMTRVTRGLRIATEESTVFAPYYFIVQKWQGGTLISNEELVLEE